MWYSSMDIIALIELRNNMDYLPLQEATSNCNNLINQVSASHRPTLAIACTMRISWLSRVNAKL
jgi:hypothetical protein